MKKINIAIDGHSSCGKSTLAKAMAEKLHYIYADSGAMYRAVTLYFLEHHVPLDDETAIRAALHDISIRFERLPSGLHTILNGKDVETEIREMRVSARVSPVAAISSVRRAMVRQQQQMGAEKGVVMDGRDIGTVVFPYAELKIFLTAEIEERARRRYAELKAKGMEVSLEEVARNLQERDHIDSTREDSPLMKAEDAVVIDNTHLTPDHQLQIALDLAQQRIDGVQ
ncbi:MAG: (d)CMP kinase [Saprospiraceae bacterium]|nr:(d)CMP kinase [Lewinella sp.]